MLPTYVSPKHLAPETHAGGIPELAFLISTDEDFSVFRQFSELSARNLLYMQNELVRIDDELHAIDGMRTHNITYEQHMTENAKRDALLSQLNVTMERYHTALVLREKVHKMSSPPDKTARSFDYWNQRALCGKIVGDMLPLEDNHSESADQYWRMQDYVLLKPARTDSLLERFTRNYLGWIFREHPPVPNHWSVYYFSRSRVERLKDWLAFPLACVFLIAPALLFHYICDGDRRLAIMLGFIIGLAALVQVVMRTTRKQTLGVALTYTGVMSLLLSGATQGARCV